MNCVIILLGGDNVKMTEISRTEAVAFYNKADAQDYIIKVMNEQGIVGIDVNIEETGMEDRRTAATLTVYTVTTFYDLTEIKTKQ